jgi:hypothetical protein
LQQIIDSDTTLTDGLGSVRQATDESGVIVGYHKFDPYGNPVADGGDPYGNTCKWWEDDIGLLHLGEINPLVSFQRMVNV